MKIGMIQVRVRDDLSENLDQVKTLAKKCIENHADILVFPEIWNCPYTNEKIRQSVPSYDPCAHLMRSISQTGQCLVVAGTLAHKIDQKIYNECLIFDHGEQIATYQKTHLFEIHTNHTDYQEKDVFTPGNALCTFPTSWGTMGVLICYDIRFPEMTRLLAQAGAQIIFCPAAFNKQVTQAHWTPLFQTRAMENQVFMVGVNPAQYQFDNFESFGHSIITDPFGKTVYQMDEKEPVAIVDIDLNRIQQIRDRMPFWKIRRTDLY